MMGILRGNLKKWVDASGGLLSYAGLAGVSVRYLRDDCQEWTIDDWSRHMLKVQTKPTGYSDRQAWALKAELKIELTRRAAVG